MEVWQKVRMNEQPQYLSPNRRDWLRGVCSDLPTYPPRSYYPAQLRLADGHLSSGPNALNRDSPSFLPHGSIHGSSSVPHIIPRQPLITFV